MTTPTEEELGHTISKDAKRYMQGSPKARPDTSPCTSVQHRDRPLSARSREILRRAASTGFRAAAASEGKEAAASRISAPSPSPTPPAAIDMQGAAILIWEETHVEEETQQSPQITSPKTKRPSSSASMNSNSGRTTPLPVLMAQIEGQMPLTPNDLVSDRTGNEGSPRPGHVHFASDAIEDSHESEGVLMLFGQKLAAEGEEQKPTLTEDGEYLTVSQEKVEPVGDVSENRIGLPGKSTGSPPRPRGHHPPRSPRQKEVETTKQEQEVRWLIGRSVLIHEAQAPEPARAIQPVAKSGKPSTPLVVVDQPMQSSGHQPRPAPTQRNMEFDNFEDDITFLASISAPNSIDTIAYGALDGRWIHKGDTARYEIIQDTTVCSQDGTVMELRFKAEDHIARRTAHMHEIVGRIEAQRIMWNNGEIWFRDEEDGKAPRSTESSFHELSAKRRSRPSKPAKPSDSSYETQRELRRIMGALPSPRKSKRASALRVQSTELAEEEDVHLEDEEVLHNASASVSSATGDFPGNLPLPQNTAKPSQAEPSQAVVVSTEAEVQCTSNDSLDAGSTWRTTTTSNTKERLVLLHRCNPEIVDLQRWKKLQERPYLPSNAEVYHQRFSETFPGVMECKSLANKAGGKTLAQAAAAELAMRSTMRQSWQSTPRARSWR